MIKKISQNLSYTLWVGFGIAFVITIIVVLLDLVDVYNGIITFKDFRSNAFDVFMQSLAFPSLLFSLVGMLWVDDTRKAVKMIHGRDLKLEISERIQEACDSNVSVGSKQISIIFAKLVLYCKKNKIDLTANDEKDGSSSHVFHDINRLLMETIQKLWMLQETQSSQNLSNIPDLNMSLLMVREYMKDDVKEGE